MKFPIPFSGRDALDRAKSGARQLCSRYAQATGVVFRGAVVAAFAATVSQSVAQLKLVSPDRTSDARFGASVLVSGGKVYVGAPGTAIGGNISVGSVYVFSASTGALQGRVVVSGNASDDRFGESLCIIGDTLYAGAPGRSGPDWGSVYSVALPLTGHQVTASHVKAPDAASNESFGAAIGRFGDALAIGAPEGPAGQEVGKAYASDAAAVTSLGINSVAGARLGAALAGSDRILAVGSPFHPATGTQSGRLWIIDRQGGQGAFVPPGLPAFSYFGASVSVFGTQILAGAPDFDPTADTRNVGAAYLIDGRSRTLIRQIQPSENFARFGESVALFGGFGAAGASYSGVRAPEGGAFYVFRTSLLPGQAPVFYPIAPGDLRANDHFGDAISMDGSYVAIGAPDADVGGVDEAGAVYVYRLGAPPPVVKPKPRKATAKRKHVKISGSAQGGFVTIARVEYSLKRNGLFKTLRGTGRWKGQVKLKASTHKIFVRAFDAAGTVSRVVVIHVKRQAASSR